MDAITLAMIKGMGGSGSSLPPVSSTDNGKVLTVADGAWAAGINLLVVNASSTAPYKTDKTYAEIKSALAAGKTVLLVRSGDTYAYLGEDEYGILEFGARVISNAIEFVEVRPDDTTGKTSKPVLPPVNSTNNGSEIIVKSGSWTVQKKKFIVTLTPTALDYSGTMDKTVAEINAAYEAGQEIVFRVMTSATSHVDVACTATWDDGSNTYPSYNGFILSSDNGGTLIFAYTGTTNDGTKQTYSTAVYSLTPAS